MSTFNPYAQSTIAGSSLGNAPTQLIGALGGQAASNYGTLPQQQVVYHQFPQIYPHISLTDYDIELMAMCIANGHPQVEGKPSCFCMLKRLEKGISKD